MGVLAAIAGVIFAGRLNQAGPTAGLNFELDAIAAAFIGGAAVQGGVGKVVGAITGGLIMARDQQRHVADRARPASG